MRCPCHQQALKTCTNMNPLLVDHCATVQTCRNHVNYAPPLDMIKRTRLIRSPFEPFVGHRCEVNHEAMVDFVCESNHGFNFCPPCLLRLLSKSSSSESSLMDSSRYLNAAAGVIEARG